MNYNIAVLVNQFAHFTVYNNMFCYTKTKLHNKLIFHRDI